VHKCEVCCVYVRAATTSISSLLDKDASDTPVHYNNITLHSQLCMLSGPLASGWPRCMVTAYTIKETDERTAVHETIIGRHALDVACRVGDTSGEEA
jgi:hypothetical protein